MREHDGLIARPEDIANTEDAGKHSTTSNTTVYVAPKPENSTASNGTREVTATEGASRTDVKEGNIEISWLHRRTRKCKILVAKHLLLEIQLILSVAVTFAEPKVSLTRTPHVVPVEDKVEDAEPDFSVEGDRQRKAAEDDEEEPIDIRRVRRDAEGKRNDPFIEPLQRSVRERRERSLTPVVAWFY